MPRARRRYHEEERQNLYCSLCHEPCREVAYDDSFSYSYGSINGVHKQYHMASDCCDAAVSEGFNCLEWCEFWDECSKRGLPCPYGQ